MLTPSSGWLASNFQKLSITFEIYNKKICHVAVYPSLYLYEVLVSYLKPKMSYLQKTLFSWKFTFSAPETHDCQLCSGNFNKFIFGINRVMCNRSDI